VQRLAASQEALLQTVGEGQQRLEQDFLLVQKSLKSRD
jgi:hypothetical protein